MTGPPLILAYHGINDIPSRHDPGRLFVSPDRFSAQVHSLARRGYRFVPMLEFASRLHAGSTIRGLCALTFDDGSEDNATILASTLRALEVPATLYVCPGLLGEPYPWCAPEAGLRFMTADAVRDLARDPLIEIGSHTRKHPLLTNASPEEAYDEMASSKRDLEELLGTEVSSFAYPHCKYSPACPSAAERAGYVSAVTCGKRGGWEAFELRRQAMRRDDGPVTFALKSRGLHRRLRDFGPVDLAARTTRPYRHSRRA
jgi:peptidoglycan/xylan/chitin deacetylase (PgdA/CDA1 family)